MNNKTMRKTTAPAFLQEAFLTNYLFADVFLAAYCTVEEMRVVYERYASVFGVHDGAWLDKIWNIVSSDLFAVADNANDFYRLVRLAKQYPEKISPTESYVLSQKAFAIQSKTEFFQTQNNVPFDALFSTLARKAAGGNTHCTALLAFLEYHGILVRRNQPRAEKRIRLASTWNHTFALLMGARYSESPAVFHRKLRTLFCTSSNESAWLYLKDELEIPDGTESDQVAAALEYAFCHNTLNPGQAHPDIMKLIGSVVLNERAKSELIKSLKNAESLSRDIPLGITSNTEIRFTPTAFDSAENPQTAERRSEAERIHANLSVLDLRGTSIYKPLLFVCDDELVLEYYRKAVAAAFAETPLTHIRLHDGDDCNLTHSSDNLFIAAMQKHHERNVVVLIDHCELLNQEKSAELAAYLKASNRKHHETASSPSVEVDLSGVLPILFATKVPNAAIAERCDIIMAAKLSHAEFHTVLAQSLQSKQADFKLSSLSMAPDVPEFLFDYSSAAVNDLLNKAIGQLRAESSDVCITVPVLQDLVNRYESGNNRGGFWRDSIA